jgi:L-cysteine S-thiosulfotransferase
MKRPHITHNLTISLISGIALISGLLIVSCAPKEDSPTGFILPPGDAMTGQTTFAALGCINCHKVDGVSFTGSDEIQSELIVTLGGKQPRVKTYGQLVTAIIHPNAAILKNDERYMNTQGDSLMPDYTQLMTVQQMTDLVTFLAEHYDIDAPVYAPQGLGYPYY